MKTLYILLVSAACIYARAVEEWDSNFDSAPSMVDKSVLVQEESQIDELHNDDISTDPAEELDIGDQSEAAKVDESALAQEESQIDESPNDNSSTDPAEELDSGDESDADMVDETALAEDETQIDELEEWSPVFDFEDLSVGCHRRKRRRPSRRHCHGHHCCCWRRWKIAFSAYLSRDYTCLRNGQKVVFDKVILNDGSGYQPTTGVFRAPRNGVYFFSYTVAQRGQREIRVKLVRNGVTINSAVAEGPKQYGDVQGSNTAVLYLSRGTPVWIEGHRGNHLEGDNGDHRFTTFTGFLIYGR